jgi:hypothetical protein
MRKQTKIEIEHLEAIVNYCKDTDQSIKTLFRKELKCYNTKQVDGIIKGTHSMAHDKICVLLEIVNEYNETK